MFNGTLRLEILGKVAMHPWVRVDGNDQDAYSLFMSHSSAMDWADAGSGDQNRMTWGMNYAQFGRDVQQALFSDPQLDDPVSDDAVVSAQVTTMRRDTSLPLMPMAECLRATVERVGTLTLEGLRVWGLGVPPTAATHDVSNLTSALGWFLAADPSAPCTVSALVRVGASRPAIDYREVAAVVRDLYLDPFQLDVGADGITIAVPEWTVAAASWAATLLAYATDAFVGGDHRDMGCIELRPAAAPAGG